MFEINKTFETMCLMRFLVKNNRESNLFGDLMILSEEFQGFEETKKKSFFLLMTSKEGRNSERLSFWATEVGVSVEELISAFEEAEKKLKEALNI